MPSLVDALPPPTRLVFSLTTTARRLSQPEIESVVVALVEGQIRRPNAVYLAVPPDVAQLPAWLTQLTLRQERLHVLKMKRWPCWPHGSSNSAPLPSPPGELFSVDNLAECLGRARAQRSARDESGHESEQEALHSR